MNIWNNAKATLRIAVDIFKFASVVYVLKEYAFDITICRGPSMFPTINPVGDVCIVNKWAAFRGSIRKGDVVICSSPTVPNDFVCKRIVGVSGDTVTIDSDSLFASTITVPENHVWLEGDNKGKSHDSRNYGPIPSQMVRGKVVFRFWPPNKMGYIE
eukprot:TRINITY_DN1183_c0_g1_i4.p1 TRINITY_DN1183_c0_g1~~TRINITY_DN1183_c0_g1_i4.p1  ORF type:complete len:157 (+),score=23.00 TRINITY_DN1183_c0_g1_i4:90-560(+)